MSTIPAPLANRHTATTLAGLAVLGALAVLLPLLVPRDAPGGLAVAIVVRLVLAAEAAWLALATLLVWRTLSRRSRYAVDTPVAAIGGFVLIALAELAMILTDAGMLPPPFPTVVLFVALLGVVLAAAGLLALNAGVLLFGVWQGPTRFSLSLSAVLLALSAWALTSAPSVLAAVAVALASLSFLGLVVGLRSPRPVANAGVPQGAARA